MGNITRRITLTSAGTKSGPLYDIYYSIDCVNYVIAINGNARFMAIPIPYADVIIPDNAACIKVVNLSQDCNNNEEIEVIIPPTTTTPPPTTSTTTLPPTTTTLSPTTTNAPNTIERVGSCTPNQTSTNYTISGNSGDVVVVRATFSGQIRKEGSTGQATAGLSLDGVSGQSACFNDTSYHFVSVVVENTYTMTGPTLTVNTSAVTWNSFETLMSLNVQIVSVNGFPSSASTSGCRGDSTGGPC